MVEYVFSNTTEEWYWNKAKVLRLGNSQTGRDYARAAIACAQKAGNQPVKAAAALLEAVWLALASIGESWRTNNLRWALGCASRFNKQFGLAKK